MPKSLIQEYQLFRVCLCLTFFAALSVAPLEHIFVPAGKLWWMYGIILVSLLYSAALFFTVSERRLQMGVHIFISCHLFFTTGAVYLHHPHYLVPTFILTYTCICIFNTILTAWPAVAAMNALILTAALLFMFVPGSGFSRAVQTIGMDVPFTTTAVAVYFALVLIVSTGLVAIKRRTESQLRELNRTLNLRVEEKVEEFKRMDQVARQTQEQLARILKSIPVGVVIMDSKLNLLYSNGVHYPEIDAAGGVKEGKDRLPVEERKEYFLQEQASLVLQKGGDMLGRRYEYHTADKMKIILRYSYVQVKLSGGDVDDAHLVLITEDITQEEGIREKLVQTNHLAGMGKMAASLIHEVNNPLAGIRLNLELLEMGLAVPEKRQKVFYALNEGVERIDRIVKSFLAFARQEHPQKVHTDIHLILEDILVMAVNFKEFHRITIQKEFDDRLPAIMADRYRLEQVFVNLLNNACDAMQRKGGLLKISTGQEEGFLFVKFKDNGIGIKQEELHHIFSPFYTTKERGHGTGLGLSTSYGIVQEHGGSIEVESCEGMGSTFIVRLPLGAGEGQADAGV
ncbi:GHKL domain-containing protein [candidate division FCPU426 bacterium]|nr:GHKL domain-containing protein [candidate division FCPU426 bacterium]